MVASKKHSIDIENGELFKPEAVVVDVVSVESFKQQVKNLNESTTATKRSNQLFLQEEFDPSRLSALSVKVASKQHKSDLIEEHLFKNIMQSIQSSSQMQLMTNHQKYSLRPLSERRRNLSTCNLPPLSRFKTTTTKASEGEMKGSKTTGGRDRGEWRLENKLIVGGNRFLSSFASSACCSSLFALNFRRARRTNSVLKISYALILILSIQTKLAAAATSTTDASKTLMPSSQIMAENKIGREISTTRATIEDDDGTSSLSRSRSSQKQLAVSVRDGIEEEAEESMIIKNKNSNGQNQDHGLLKQMLGEQENGGELLTPTTRTKLEEATETKLEEDCENSNDNHDDNQSANQSNFNSSNSIRWDLSSAEAALAKGAMLASSSGAGAGAGIDDGREKIFNSIPKPLEPLPSGSKCNLTHPLSCELQKKRSMRREISEKKEKGKSMKREGGDFHGNYQATANSMTRTKRDTTTSTTTVVKNKKQQAALSAASSKNKANKKAVTSKRLIENVLLADGRDIVVAAADEDEEAEESTNEHHSTTKTLPLNGAHQRAMENDSATTFEATTIAGDNDNLTDLKQNRIEAARLANKRQVDARERVEKEASQRHKLPSSTSEATSLLSANSKDMPNGARWPSEQPQPNEANYYQKPSSTFIYDSLNEDDGNEEQEEGDDDDDRFMWWHRNLIEPEDDDLFLVFDGTATTTRQQGLENLSPDIDIDDELLLNNEDDDNNNNNKNDDVFDCADSDNEPTKMMMPPPPLERTNSNDNKTMNAVDKSTKEGNFNHYNHRRRHHHKRRRHRQQQQQQHQSGHQNNGKEIGAGGDDLLSQERKSSPSSGSPSSSLKMSTTKRARRSGDSAKEKLQTIYFGGFFPWLDEVTQVANPLSKQPLASNAANELATSRESLGSSSSSSKQKQARKRKQQMLLFHQELEQQQQQHLESQHSQPQQQAQLPQSSYENVTLTSSSASATSYTSPENRHQLGRFILPAVRLALDHINTNASVLGSYRLEIVPRDTQVSNMYIHCNNLSNVTKFIYCHRLSLNNERFI